MVRIPYFEALTDDQFALLSPGEMMDAYAELRGHHVFETQELWRRLGDAKKRAGDRLTIEDLREIAVLRGGDSLGVTDEENGGIGHTRDDGAEAMRRAFEATPEELEVTPDDPAYFPGTRLSIRHIAEMMLRDPSALDEIRVDYPYLTVREVRLAMLIHEAERERDAALAQVRGGVPERVTIVKPIVSRGRLAELADRVRHFRVGEEPDSELVVESILEDVGVEVEDP